MEYLNQKFEPEKQPGEYPEIGNTVNFYYNRVKGYKNAIITEIDTNNCNHNGFFVRCFVEDEPGVVLFLRYKDGYYVKV